MKKFKRICLLALTAAIAFAQQPFVPVNTGIGFVLQNSATPKKHQPETMPGGVAILDYDNDGKLDLYFVNGAEQPSLKKTAKQWQNHLYRNLGNWKFENVTERAGLAGEGYGMGAAAADYDNDGFTDLLVTSLGFSRLYRNRGDGTFQDVTQKSGVPATPWPISAGWLDYDNDGYVDLLISNYCLWNPLTEPFCGDVKAGYRTYCHPQYYEGLPNTLLHNNGDGTFTDVSRASGISARIGKGMAVAFADYNLDGRTDVFVTNDTTPNFLFRNDGDGRFTEAGLTAGVAIVDDGKVLSSMGADFKDIDNDGRPDLFLTALANETFPLYRNLGNGLFGDMTYRSRIGAASMPHSGWGLGVFDFNNDGWKDIFTANGDVQDNTELFSSRASKQQNQLFLNKGDGAFSSTLFGEAAQHRGAAFGDLDGDGRIDAVVTRLNATPLVLRNTLGEGNHWLAVNLKGRKSNRDGLGAKIRIVAAGKQQFWEVSTAVGYLSSSEKTARFGLGKSASVELIEITWPAGAIEILKDVRADQILTVEEPPAAP